MDFTVDSPGVKVLSAPSRPVLPKAKMEDLPEECRGCGRCCGPEPILSFSEREYQDISLSGQLAYSALRGMSFRRINGVMWLMSPPCKFLYEGECSIHSAKPLECRNFKRGCDACLMMFAVHETKSKKS